MEVNGKTQNLGQVTAPTPAEFIRLKVREFQEQKGKNPSLLILSTDVLRDLSKEAVSLGLITKNDAMSVTLMLKKPMSFAGLEIVICGGEKRMALI